ncbi:phenylalanine--tRNA ligase subunit beta [Candidatus Poribacteria bacterium]|nr:phenylalanine--tRNA ligase subunit beta [Candidatus Poribacteria bacterium]
MQVSTNWLRDYVATTLSLDELAAKFTMLGVEVEETFPLNEGIGDIIVARIETVAPHPHADRLSVCQVSTGAETVGVVCGAPNARAGMVAPFAPVGSKLPAGMEIAETEIRGIRSQGMLCSAKELAISDDADGLMELSASLTLGAPLVEALHLDDTALEISITPNRPDCLSMIGLAREIATVEHLQHALPEIDVPEGQAATEDLTSVEINDPSLCPRYAARVIRDVTIGPSPSWLQQRLRASGLRPINNVVDITNFVLLEIGHPLHAFDYERLAENRIVVRRARSRETLTTLDGKTHTLNSETLVIADAEKPVALAGIMGGAECEVSGGTEHILLESAYFNPVSIRRAAKALAIQTDASYRFERGADPEAVITALDRAAQLIAEVAGGEVCRGVVDAYPTPAEPVSIEFRPRRANKVLGTHIPKKEMVRILDGLGFGVTDGGRLTVTVPTFRPDITREIDLVEEIARVHGYDAIPVTIPVGEIPNPRLDPFQGLKRCIHEVMHRHGLYEACHVAWYATDELQKLRPENHDPIHDQIAVENPLSREMAVLRTSLLPSLLQSVAYNRRHQVEHVALYELQRVFIPGPLGELPDEQLTLAGAVSGASAKHWSTDDAEPDFYDVKGIVEALLEEVDITDASLDRSESGTLHPGRSATLSVGGEEIGFLGEVHPEVLQSYGLTQRVYVFSVNVDRLAEHGDSTRWMDQLPPFPNTTRDLAIVVDEDVPAEEVLTAIRESVSGLLASITLFDVYTGEHVAEGKKSLAFALEYRSHERTLTDTEVEKLQAQILHSLEEQLGAVLRS